MDRQKSFLSPQNLIIYVVVCTVVALWAVVFAALYFYFIDPRLSPVVHNMTDVKLPLFLPNQLPWYLNGTVLPSTAENESDVPLWHHQLPLQPLARLQKQLMFLPKGSEKKRIILFWSDWSPSEEEEYQASKCPIKSCEFTSSRKNLTKVNAIVFRNTKNLLHDFPQEYYRPQSQVWVLNSLNMPEVGEFIHPKDVFNWTATPRLDSDIPMFPNGIWMYYDTRWKYQDLPLNRVVQKSLAAAAWFPTTCNNKSNAYHYISRLQHYTLVDGFSNNPNCGEQCPQNQIQICLNLLQDKYRVTLVFEDRNCNHSIPDMFYTALNVLVRPNKQPWRYQGHVPTGICPDKLSLTLVVLPVSHDMGADLNTTFLHPPPIHFSKWIRSRAQTPEDGRLNFRKPVVLCSKTQKNGLKADINKRADTIPVVMSPPRSIYEQVVPEGSFIHVDDFGSPRDLARHLETIYEDDVVFNKYLSWKGTGMFVKTWYCRLCALLHHNSPENIEVDDINQWWNPVEECSS